MNNRNVSEVRVYPFYPGIATEVPPVVSNAKGTLATATMMGQEVHQLSICDGQVSGNLQVGATYSWIGRDHDGEHTTSHWLYCTSLSPMPTFGAICDWTRKGTVFPLLAEIDSELVYLEELTDFSAVLPGPNPAFGEASTQLGKVGRLVQTTATAPGYLGVLIEDPVMPHPFAVGTSNISITAKSSRTMQTIAMQRMHCARIGNTALFLQAGPPWG